LGIINGVNDNTLSPDGNFTRAQAAKIITYMLLGTEAGEALGTQTVAEADRKFSDYTYNTKWAIPYVEYCASVGIVEGYEDGNFYPNRNVTATQWLKMLVAALRYDKNKLNGKDWAKYTYDAAIYYNVITADEFKLDFDRETAILYAFNALTSTAWEKESMAQHQFNLEEQIVYDQYARPTDRNILSNGKVVTTFKINNEGVKNTTAKVDANAYYVEDGQLNETVGTVMGGNSATVYTYNNYAFGGKNGSQGKAIAYEYGHDYGKTTIVVNTYVEKLTKANTAAYVKLNSSLKVGDVVTYTVGNTYWTKLDKQSVPTKLTVERVDAVAGTVTAANRSDDATKNYVKIDYGSAILFARFAKNGPDAQNGSLKTLATAQKFNLYYDAYGNIIYAEDYTEPAREGDLVFLTKVSATAVPVVTEGESVEYNVTYKVQYIDLTDGSLKTATASKPDNLPVLSITATAAATTGTYPVLTEATAPNVYYELATNEDGTVESLGEYTFNDGKQDWTTRKKASVTQNKAEFTLGKYTTGLANKDTVLTVISYKDGFEKDSYVTQTGIANFTTATYELAGTFTTAVLGENGYATHIYVIAPVAVPETTEVYAMYIGEDEDSADDGQAYKFVGADGQEFVITYAQANGKVDKGVIANGSDAFDGFKNKTIAAGTVVKLTEQNGEFTAVDTAVAVAKTGELYYVEDKNNFNVGGTVYYFAANYSGVVINTKTYGTASWQTHGTDINGLDVTGTTVTLYENSDHEIVFATTTPASK
jgi:hypothetical protein